MASCTIENSGQTISINAGRSILNNLLENDVSISHICGGKAQCGTCRIVIIRGHDFLSPKTDIEKVRLSKINAGPDMRLACQTYTYGDIKIFIPPKPEQ